MLLYRVECRKGWGAYHHLDNGVATATSPIPQNDPGLDWGGNWGDDWEDLLFSFSSLEQFRSWFSEHELWLIAGDCELSVYECEVYKLGDYQAVFDPARAKLIERRLLLETYNER